jgi:phospholipid/cholesterol/gamma-HCH transport system ATP-binding protein
MGASAMQGLSHGLGFPFLHTRGAAVFDAPASREAHIEVCDLTMAYGDFVIQRDLQFTIRRGDIFIIMGGSGCGKSTLLRHLVGLLKPARGQVLYEGVSLWDAEPEERRRIMRKFGILYQSGALWSSMTLAENVALPLGEYTRLGPRQIDEIVALKLALVGLAGFEDFYPAEISGGMQKRAGLARAMALDPDILFFDEPSAGLDPISARRLDDLILELRDSLGTTVVVVTHELSSIFTIGSNSVFLDPETKTMIAGGDPHRLLKESCDPRVLDFLTRGEYRARQAGRAGASNSCPAKTESSRGAQVP